MGLFLQPDVIITSDHRGAILFRQGVRIVHRLNIAEAIALTFLGATGDRRVAEMYCSECLPERKGSQWINRVLNRYWTYLGNGPPRPINFDWLEVLDKDQACIQPGPFREAAPSAITWLVTLSCNRRCPYCFYDVTYLDVKSPVSPSDATFLLPDVLKMIQEMAQIGAADLYLTGGEPLLRKDLLNIIHVAKSVRVRTHLNTKYPVERRLAQKLAQAGLYSAIVSLDDARPEQAAALAGSPGYLDEAKATITSFLNAGIQTEINVVVTKMNINHLDLLIKLSISLGVHKMNISQFIIPYPQRPATKCLSPPAVNLTDIVDSLRQRYEHRIALKVAGSVASDTAMEKSRGKQTICDVGLQALDVLPDGRVTRCRYLPDHNELVIGSLQRQTLLEIWEGDQLSALNNPDRGIYEDKACTKCGIFDACNNRGRCYLTALTKSGYLYAPDAFCLQERQR